MSEAATAAYAQLLSVGLLWISFHCAGMCGTLLIGFDVAGAARGASVPRGALSLLTYQLGRAGTAAGHIGLIMMICKSGLFGFITRPLAAVGRMALTNYLAHSVICMFLFTGVGLAWFAELERYELYYVVGGIWLFQLIVSPIWLRYFRFGPMEWV